MNTPLEEIKGSRGWFDAARSSKLDIHSLTPKSEWISADESVQQIEKEYESPLDCQLSWDHIDCGFDKGWFRDELMLAFSARLNPDCAFSECSYCGVCGDELGHNLTIPPPAIPVIESKSTDYIAPQQSPHSILEKWSNDTHFKP